MGLEKYFTYQIEQSIGIPLRLFYYVENGKTLRIESFLYTNEILKECFDKLSFLKYNGKIPVFGNTSK